MKRISHRALYVVVGLIALYTVAPARQTIRVDVSLVNIFATVQDAAGQFVTGLSRDDFRVYEDGVLQEIRIFESEESVLSSVGMLVDTSGSMVDVLPFMSRGIRGFTTSLPEAYEFFLVSFGASPRLMHGSSQGPRHLEESLDQLRASGISLLFDALLFSNRKVLESERPRKALVVFTDGIFTDESKGNSPYTRVVQEAQRSSVLLYFIVIGPSILVDSNTVESLSSISGGRTFYASRNESVAAALDQIRAELSRQYYLAYYMSRKSGFHGIRVEVPGRNVKVRAKMGYIGD